jgi:hypothetical protein
VRLVSRAQLQLNFITPLCVSILEQQIEPAGARMDALLISQNEIAHPKDRGIIRDQLLHPLLGELGMCPKPQPFGFDVTFRHQVSPKFD